MRLRRIEPSETATSAATPATATTTHDHHRATTPSTANRPASTRSAKWIRKRRMVQNIEKFRDKLKSVRDASDTFRRFRSDLQKAEIEFTDQRYAERFSRFPMHRVWPDMLSVLSAQKRGDTGEIRTPDTVRDGDFDLICIGSPTWWQTVSMPMRCTRFMARMAGTVTFFWSISPPRGPKRVTSPEC